MLKVKEAKLDYYFDGEDEYKPFHIKLIDVKPYKLIQGKYISLRKFI